MSAEQNLIDLGIRLPEPPTPKGNYVPGLVHGGILYLSGQGRVLENGELATGIVGQDFSLDEAYYHARRTGLVLLSAARLVLGSLDHVERVLHVYGMVNAAPDFVDHPRVINGCSDLMVEVFGDKGRHTRAAVGMGTLPFRISVEITAMMAVSS
jgi:enamine deaminase RidA (YjgF/YER057c/UK114 family)